MTNQTLVERLRRNAALWEPCAPFLSQLLTEAADALTGQEGAAPYPRAEGRLTPEQVEHRLRQELWLGHGHQGLYGDDGEMQCSRCLPTWDYKRAPLADVIAAAEKARMERAAKAWQEHKAVQPTREGAEREGERG